MRCWGFAKTNKGRCRLEGKSSYYPFCGNHGPFQSAAGYLLYKGGWLAFGVRILCVVALALIGFLSQIAGLNADLPKLQNDITNFFFEEQMPEPSYIARQEVYLTGISIEFDFTDTRFKDVEILRVDLSTEDFPSDSVVTASFINEANETVEVDLESAPFNIGDDAFALIRRGTIPTLFAKVYTDGDLDPYFMKIEHVSPHPIANEE